MDLAPLLRSLLEFDSALLANTIGYIDPTPAADIYLGGSIQCQTPELGPVAGVAFTCEMDTSSPAGAPAVDLYYDQIEQMKAKGLPCIWVVKAVGSRPDHECIMGDGMAKDLGSAGCKGIVTDGGIRDVATYASVPFHAFARGRVIHHTAIRAKRINAPVEVGGLTIRPGDIIHGSAEGVIRIPPGCLERLPERAAKMRAFEHEAHFLFRESNMPQREKAAKIQALLKEYGFR